MPADFPAPANVPAPSDVPMPPDLWVPADAPVPADPPVAADLRAAVPHRPVPPQYPLAYRPPNAARVSWVGPVIGLVLVLVVACGGLAFASWLVVGSRNGPIAAGPATGSATPATPATSEATSAPEATSASAAPSPSPTEPSPASAGSAAVPFGTAHMVTWPDHLAGYVLRVRHSDQFGYSEVDVEAKIINNSSVDVDLTQAHMRLWFGSDHTSASAAGVYDGGEFFFGVVHPGHTANGGLDAFVPEQYLKQLVVEIVPRPGDAPALFAGAAD